MKAKYVVVKICGLPVPVLCPENAGITHEDLAAKREVVAAGFVRIDGKDVLAHGESVSLGAKSRGSADAALIAKCYCGVETEEGR